MFSITQSGLTLQNSEIFSLMLSSIGSSDLITIISGDMPIVLSSFTECCVGFDLCSPELFRYGTSVTWMNRQFSFPCSSDTCLIASRNGWLSISPTVPPISVIITSALLVLPTLYMNSLISLVMCGITCTVLPRYSPFLSLLSTFQ